MSSSFPDEGGRFGVSAGPPEVDELDGDEPGEDE
jgi:hypothetical protein